jgi:hypothetical protein
LLWEAETERQASTATELKKSTTFDEKVSLIPFAAQLYIAAHYVDTTSGNFTAK